MLKKVFIQCMFGTPHPWIQPYLDHFGRLEESGWFMRIFTPNQLDAPPNVEVISMTVEEYDRLMGQKCGVFAGNYLKDGVPAKLVSDHYCAFGQIFQDYIKDFDFWGITNFDVVYGRLSKFVSDLELAGCDIWADEGSVAINGIFSLFRNDPRINRLYEHVDDWRHLFSVHEPCGFDEIRMTHAVRKLAAAGDIRFGHPDHFPLHSYDRLVQHQPMPNLYFESDGALIERYDDRVHFPNEKGCFGREIPLFHFSRTKKWPVAA